MEMEEQMVTQHVKLKHQAAGHDGPLTDTEERLLFKPTIQAEIDFYQAIQCEVHDPQGNSLPLETWMPAYLGNLERGISQNVEKSCLKTFELGVSEGMYAPELNQTVMNRQEGPYLVLENLLYGFRSPNILDVKLGKVLYDETASEEKKKRLQRVSTETTSGKLGFRICGMKIEANSCLEDINSDHYQAEDDNYVFVNKMYGRSLTQENVLDGFKLFLNNNHLSTKRKRQLIELFLQRLQLFYNTLLDEEIRLISSSLLFIYEGDPRRWDEVGDEDCLIKNDFVTLSDSNDAEGDEEEDEEETVSSPLSSLSLIDFAHSRVFKGHGYDENVIAGVENLIDIFTELLECL